MEANLTLGVTNTMKNKMLILAIAGAAFAVAPAFANGGPVSSVGSLLGSTTALVVDVPEGVLVDSLYYVPHKTVKSLASAFGDEHGLLQNVVGMTIGIPVGVTWGIPYGALHGAKHALGTGWDKPFSTESYIVTEEK
jgi:hypothetical protein